MKRFLAPWQVFFIPPVAVLTVIGLSMTPWGSMYQTLIGHASIPLSIKAEEQVVAPLILSGIEKPKVDVVVGEVKGGMEIRVGVRAGAGNVDQEQMTLTIPLQWELLEVRGVHVQEVAKYDSEERKTLMIPYTQSDIEFRFRTNHPFELIAFSHTDESPALLSFTHIMLPERNIEREVKIVDGAVALPLL